MDRWRLRRRREWDARVEAHLLRLVRSQRGPAWSGWGTETPPAPHPVVWLAPPKPGQGIVHAKPDGTRWFTQDGVEFTRIP